MRARAAGIIAAEKVRQAWTTADDAAHTRTLAAAIVTALAPSNPALAHAIVVEKIHVRKCLEDVGQPAAPLFAGERCTRCGTARLILQHANARDLVLWCPACDALADLAPHGATLPSRSAILVAGIPIAREAAPAERHALADALAASFELDVMRVRRLR